MNYNLGKYLKIKKCSIIIEQMWLNSITDVWMHSALSAENTLTATGHRTHCNTWTLNKCSSSFIQKIRFQKHDHNIGCKNIIKVVSKGHF